MSRAGLTDGVPGPESAMAPTKEAPATLEWHEFAPGIMQAAEAHRTRGLADTATNMDALARSEGTRPLSHAEMQQLQLEVAAKSALDIVIALRHHEHAARAALSARLDALEARLRAMEAAR